MIGSDECCSSHVLYNRRRRWLLCCILSIFLLIMTGGQWIYPRNLHTFDAPSFFPTATVTVFEYVEDTPLPTPVPVLPKVQEPLAARSPPECEVKPLELPKPKQSRLSDSLFPLSEKHSESWASENNRMIRDLFRCLEDDCAVNQDKSASFMLPLSIASVQTEGHVADSRNFGLVSFSWSVSRMDGWRGFMVSDPGTRLARFFLRISERAFIPGRDRRYAFDIVDLRPRAPIIDRYIPLQIQALQNMNYTILYSLNNDRAVQLYQTFPQLVKAVLLEPPDVWECFRDEESCVQSERNPHGIPIWKVSFAFSSPSVIMPPF